VLLGRRYLGDGQVRAADGRIQTITVRKKTADASYFSPSIPATSKPRYAVGGGVKLVTPTGMVAEAERGLPTQVCIVGAGKTAMDVGIWLPNRGVKAEAISWVMPRDS
jgi:hypothetical protein